MKKRIFLICTAAIITGLLIQTDGIAGPNKIWVPEHKTATGAVIPGHWRPASKPGFTWVEGMAVNGVWEAGYWKPVGPAPAGKIWVKGYWRNGKWHNGRWAVKKNGVWVPGHYNRSGRWISGHYK